MGINLPLLLLCLQLMCDLSLSQVHLEESKLMGRSELTDWISYRISFLPRIMWEFLTPSLRSL